MSNQALWGSLSSHLLSVLNEHEFNTWFSRTSLTVNDGTATLLVPNYLFLNWIKDNYHNLLEQALILVSGKPMLLSLAIAGNSAPLPEAPVLPPENEPVSLSDKKREYSSLNPRYVFSNFLVGSSNKLAHAACKAVASQPGGQYNPLFIYGGTGLGKTHLLCAVGNAILDNNPSAKVYYCSAENFTNDLFKAVRFDGVNSFQEKYRHVDCLLLDDIQFLGGKERTQEEFFHTFNTLYNYGKQIVVTSDKMPKDIIYLGKKVCSRFECGLLADLQPPDEELKMSILYNKALERGIELGLNVAQFLARQPDSNIRALEWYLTKLIAVSEIQGVEITVEMASKIINSLAGGHKIKLEDIINIVAEYFSVAAEDIKSGRKHREVSYPRQIAMYMSRKLTRTSFLEIGKAFGNKDHSTVLKGVKRIEVSIRSNYEASEQIRRLEEYITGEKNIKIINAPG
ncbi:MAG: chromosomal replication initiator protein DnaA [Desulfarculales bacterium]|nr:chromosomal replication initiator protein DnaA [Desulfarculales bacterium]